MAEQFTLYVARNCPAAQRVEMALAEAGAQFTKFEIDLQNKPEWFAPKINPASKVPAVAYGGPKVPPDQPSPESVKIAESLVLLEFVADLYPESKLLPKDPVLRAKARFFIDAVSTKFIPGWVGFVMRGDVDAEGVLGGAEAIQALLPGDKTFAVSDEFTIADAAIVPFLARALLTLREDIGVYAPGEGQEAYEVLTSARFSQLLKYYNAITARDSFRSTYDEELAKEAYEKHIAQIKAQEPAA